MRIVHHYIYNTKTLKKVAKFGCNRAKAVKALNEMDNTECYAIGCSWHNI
jgi:hypothetical protein